MSSLSHPKQTYFPAQNFWGKAVCSLKAALHKMKLRGHPFYFKIMFLMPLILLSLVTAMKHGILAERRKQCTYTRH